MHRTYNEPRCHDCGTPVSQCGPLNLCRVNGKWVNLCDPCAETVEPQRHGYVDE